MLHDDGWDAYYKKEQELEDADNRVCSVPQCGSDGCTICNPTMPDHEGGHGFSIKSNLDIALEGGLL